jgi:SAM-dependent methyltransferase
VTDPRGTSAEAVVRRERAIRDREAATYDSRSDRLRWELQVEDLVFDSLLDLRAGQTVLDAGCGTGRHLPWLVGEGRSVVGVDHSARSLELARERVPEAAGDRLRLEAADLRALPLGDATVDRALCSEAIGHLPSAELRAAVARELFRVLRPGGVLVCSGYRWHGKIHRHKDGYFAGGLYRYAFTRREFEAMFAEAGFAARVGAAPVAPGLAKRLRVPPRVAARVAFTPGARALGQLVIARCERA